MARAGEHMTHEERRERRRRMASRFAAGESIRDIATSEGVHVATARGACAANLPGSRRTKAETFSVGLGILGRLFDPTASYAEIAAEFSVAKSYVSKIYADATAAGIPVPPRPKTRSELVKAIEARHGGQPR